MLSELHIPAEFDMKLEVAIVTGAEEAITGSTFQSLFGAADDDDNDVGEDGWIVCVVVLKNEG